MELKDLKEGMWIVLDGDQVFKFLGCWKDDGSLYKLVDVKGKHDAVSTLEYAELWKPKENDPVISKKYGKTEIRTCGADDRYWVKAQDINTAPVRIDDLEPYIEDQHTGTDSVEFVSSAVCNPEPEFKVGDEVMVRKLMAGLKLEAPFRGVIVMDHGGSYSVKQLEECVVDGDVETVDGLNWTVLPKYMQLIPKKNDLKTINFDDDSPLPSPGETQRMITKLRKLKEEKATERRKESRWCKETNKFIHQDEDARVDHMLWEEDIFKNRQDDEDELAAENTEEFDHGKFMRELIEENRRQFWNGRIGS